MKLHSYIYQTGDYAIHDSEMLVPGPDLRGYFLAMLERGAGPISMLPNYGYAWHVENDIGCLHIVTDEGVVVVARIVPYASYALAAIDSMDLIVEESGESQPVSRGLPEDLAAPCVILFPTSVFGHLLPDEARKVLTHVYGLAVVWLESLRL